MESLRDFRVLRGEIWVKPSSGCLGGEDSFVISMQFD